MSHGWQSRFKRSKLNSYALVRKHDSQAPDDEVFCIRQLEGQSCILMAVGVMCFVASLHMPV